MACSKKKERKTNLLFSLSSPACQSSLGQSSPLQQEQRRLPPSLSSLSACLTAAPRLGASRHQGNPKEKPLHQRGVRPQRGLGAWLHTGPTKQHHPQPPRERGGDGGGWDGRGGGGGGGDGWRAQWEKWQRGWVINWWDHRWRVLQHRQTADGGKQW